MDGIALKCDLHSSLTFRSRKCNYRIFPWLPDRGDRDEYRGGGGTGLRSREPPSAPHETGYLARIT